MHEFTFSEKKAQMKDGKVVCLFVGCVGICGVCLHACVAICLLFTLYDLCVGMNTRQFAVLE